MTYLDATAAIDMLNRLFQIVYRSLPAYLAGDRVWVGPKGQPGMELLIQMATEHRLLALRLAEAIRQQGGVVDFGAFPVEFTALNDLAVEYVLREVHRRLERDVQIMRRSVLDLAVVPPLQPLAADALHMAMEQKAALQEMMKNE